MRRYKVYPNRASSTAHIFVAEAYYIDVHQEMIFPPLFELNLNNFRTEKCVVCHEKHGASQKNLFESRY